MQHKTSIFIALGIYLMVMVLLFSPLDVVLASPDDWHFDNEPGDIGRQELQELLSARETAKLTAGDGDPGDTFGWSVTTVRNRLVVGAPGDDAAGDGAGAVYVFERDYAGSAVWRQSAKITAGVDAKPGAAFGDSLAAAEEFVAVGAMHEDDDTGAVYIMVYDPLSNQWVVVKRLTAGEYAEAGAQFGQSVAMVRGTLVVGADGADGEAGAAYVFEIDYSDITNWVLVKELKAGDAASGALFGHSVAISGDTIVVGARNDSTSVDEVGAAYIFERNAGRGNAWGQVAKLTANDPGVQSRFGKAVAVDNHTVVVAAHWHNEQRGKLYVFDRDAGGSNKWGLVTTLLASDGDPGDLLGQDVQLSEDVLVATSCYDDDPSVGADTGAVYIYKRDSGGNWSQVEKLVAGDPTAGMAFGIRAGISGETLIVSSPHADSVQGAAYAFELDRWSASAVAQTAKLEIDNNMPSGLGRSVAVSGDYAVVGAYTEDSARGAAYIFARNQDGTDAWGQMARLVGDSRELGDLFGLAVAIEDNVAVIGAKGVADDDGAVYVFERSQSQPYQWTQSQKLTVGDGTGGRFGVSVAINGGVIVVGADGIAGDIGAVYVFEYTGGSWQQVSDLVAGDGKVGDLFGHTVAIDGDTLVVGARDCNNEVGAAYVFERHMGEWGHVKTLTVDAMAAGTRFGKAVAISGDTIAVGAHRDAGAGYYSGGVYIFGRNRGGIDNWGQVKKLVAADTTFEDMFGQALALDGDLLVAASFGDDDYAGSAYVFARNEGGIDSWGELYKLTPDDRMAGDEFGVATGISDGTIVIGAHIEHNQRGAAYVYDIDYDPSLERKWTVMVYLSGDNDLDAETEKLFNHLEYAVADNSDLTIRVLWDRLGEEAVLYHILPDANLDSLSRNYTEESSQWHKGELNMGEYTTLETFISETREQLPADYYLLAIVDHGGGWSPKLASQAFSSRFVGGGSGFSVDQTDDDYIATKDMETLFSKLELVENPIDLVFYDACLMGMVEEVYAIRQGADFFLASQYETFTSFPYDGYLSGIVDRTPQEQAVYMVDVHHRSLSGGPRTLAAYDLQQTSMLSITLDDLALALIDALPGQKARIEDVFLETQKLDYNYDYVIEEYEGYIDLGDFAARLIDEFPGTQIATAAESLLDVLVGAADALIVYERHSSDSLELNNETIGYVDLQGVTGISIYLPFGEDDPDYPFYTSSQIPLARDTTWDQFIFEFIGFVPQAPGDDFGGGRGDQSPGPAEITYPAFLPLIIRAS